MWMTKRRFWCMESKGDRMEKTAMVRPVIMVRRVTERTSVRWLNRLMNGTVSESVNDPVAETMIAMMCSAGASSPIRPVYKTVSMPHIATRWE